MPGLEDVLVGGAPATITTDDLVPRVRVILEDDPWEDVLSSSYTAADGTVSVGAPQQWAEGNTMEIDDATYSQFRVKAQTTGNWWDTNPISVRASYNGTTDANHASGAAVLKEPRFAGYIIKEALDRTVLDAVDWCWTVKQATLTPSATTALYELPADFLGLVRFGVVQQTTSTVPDIIVFDEWAGQVAVVRNVPESIASTTVALRLAQFGNSSEDVTVNYRARMSKTAIPDDDIADAIVFGACSRILIAKEVPLGGQDQGVADPSAVLHPGDLLRTGLAFRQEFNGKKARIRAALGRLGPPAKQYVG